MIKIGNLRIGKGIALILRKKQAVAGVGSSSFQNKLKDEVGFDYQVL